MTISTGFNHIAIVTPDLDRLVAFYEQVFQAVKTFEMDAKDDHPRMAIVDVGGDAALNVFEAAPETIVGERGTMGGRGPIDHYAVAVDSKSTLEAIRDRLVDADADIGEIHTLGDMWSLFFRDPDGMELEVCAPAAVPDSA